MRHIELPIYRTIRFQLLSAFLALFVLFSAALGYGLQLAEARERDQVVLNTAARLQLVARMMQNQALNYASTPARDYSTYFRDVKLYFDDLQSQIVTFDEALGCFTSGRFEAQGEQHSPTIYEFDASGHPTVAQTVRTWKRFRGGLDSALGETSEEPRLEAAAEFILANVGDLQEATESLFDDFQQEAQQRLDTNRKLLRLVIIAAIALLGLTMWWAHRILRPIHAAVQGFERVAQGDFGHQVAVEARNEIGVMTSAFNQMSERLKSLMRLIDSMQEGKDLAESLAAVTEGLQRFMPVDWGGVLLLSADGSELVLRHVHAPADSLAFEPRRFALAGSRMEEMLAHDKPVRIADLRLVAQPQGGSFESMLVERDLSTAMLLPLHRSGQTVGFLVFATHARHGYLLEHEELVRNLSSLVSRGFERIAALEPSAPSPPRH